MPETAQDIIDRYNLYDALKDDAVDIFIRRYSSLRNQPVLLPDHQIHCNHVVGVTTKGHAAHLIYAAVAKVESRLHGAVMFIFCPFCKAPVSQILGEVEE